MNPISHISALVILSFYGANFANCKSEDVYASAFLDSSNNSGNTASTFSEFTRLRFTDVPLTLFVVADARTILECPLGSKLVINHAYWTTCPTNTLRDPFHDHCNFDRTQAISSACNGLNSCILVPSTKINANNGYLYLGDPSSDVKNYSLYVNAMCTVDPINTHGTLVDDTVTVSNLDVKLACPEGELIHWSDARVEGLHNSMFCTFSLLDYLFHCHMKNNCVIPKNVFVNHKTGKCPFKLAVLSYYCRKPEYNSYLDRVNKANEPEKYVLSADQDSFVSISTFASKVWKVNYAHWEPVSDNKGLVKDRTDVLKYMCEGRNVCSFRLRRATGGVTDHLAEDIPFGGILKDNRNFVLKAELTLSDYPKTLPADTCEKKFDYDKTIELTCENDKFVFVVSAPWGLKDFDPEDLPTTRGNYPYSQNLAPFLDKFCYLKHKCEWHSEMTISSSLAASTGFNPQLYEVVVRYQCKDFDHLPSLVRDDSENASLLEGGVTDNLRTENILPVEFRKNSRLFVNLEVYDKSELTVGDFLKFDFPNKEGGELKATLLKDEDVSVTNAVKKSCSKYFLSILVVDDEYVDVLIDANCDGNVTDKFTVRLVTDDGKKALTLPTSFNDVVVTKGGVVGMSVYYKA